MGDMILQAAGYLAGTAFLLAAACVATALGVWACVGIGKGILNTIRGY